MRRVIIVAPSYAPSSNPPTHRVRFFARYLSRFGWQPHILTVSSDFYEDPADAEIDRLLPHDVPVTRSRALPARWTRRLGIGDLGMRAYFHLRSTLRRLITDKRPDLLLIPGPPWHTFRLGPVAKREFGIPYVLDYIDPWVMALGDDSRVWTKAFWFRQMALALEPLAVREAAQIVAVSDGTNEGVRQRYPEVPADRFTGIPYGFEASDFDELRARPRHNRFWDANDGNVHLVYVGAMLPHGYETLRALFRGVLELRASRPEIGNRLRLHFFGTTYEPNPRRGLVEPVAQTMGLSSIVSEHPARVPYLDALNILCSADGILALGSTERHYTASKIFPCILARRPLFGIYHEASTVCDVVRASNAGELVTYDDLDRAEQRVPEICAALTRISDSTTYDPERVDWSSFEHYSAENMTRVLASVLDRAVVGAKGMVTYEPVAAASG